MLRLTFFCQNFPKNFFNSTSYIPKFFLKILMNFILNFRKLKPIFSQNYNEKSHCIFLKIFFDLYKNHLEIRQNVLKLKNCFFKDFIEIIFFNISPNIFAVQNVMLLYFWSLTPDIILRRWCRGSLEVGAKDLKYINFIRLSKQKNILLPPSHFTSPVIQIWKCPLPSDSASRTFGRWTWPEHECKNVSRTNRNTIDDQKNKSVVKKIG